MRRHNTPSKCFYLLRFTGIVDFTDLHHCYGRNLAAEVVSSNRPELTMKLRISGPPTLGSSLAGQSALQHCVDIMNGRVHQQSHHLIRARTCWSAPSRSRARSYETCTWFCAASKAQTSVACRHATPLAQNRAPQRDVCHAGLRLLLTAAKVSMRHGHNPLSPATASPIFAARARTSPYRGGLRSHLSHPGACTPPELASLPTGQRCGSWPVATRQPNPSRAVAPQAIRTEEGTPGLSGWQLSGPRWPPALPAGR